MDGRHPSVVARDVCMLMGDRNLDVIYQALKALRRDGVIRFCEGSRRNMELAPGAPASIADARGRSVASLANLKYVKRNTRASMATPKAVRGRRFATDW